LLLADQCLKKLAEDNLRRKLLMQWRGILLMAALMAVVPGYARAASQSKVLKETGSPASPTKTYSPAEKKAYEEKIASDLNNMQQKINELKIKSRTVVQQKKHMAVVSLMDLQNKANAARGKLAALKTAPPNAWSGLKAKLDKSMADLSTAYQEVEAHLN
jgi:hypothetical protein